MTQELTTINPETGEIVEQTDIHLSRSPSEMLTEAHAAAVALQNIVSKKRSPVKFNGEQYLEFEDWQTLGKFYGLTVKVIDTKFVEYGTAKGFEARTVVINANTGLEISAAEALCLNDEKNWANKPLFQLKSMAQTRACAKALRNVLAWVVVLAGYKPTPAEEIQSLEPARKEQKIELAEGSQQTITEAQTVQMVTPLFEELLILNKDLSAMVGEKDVYRRYMVNSKGESPALEKIKDWKTPKQLAWMRSVIKIMADELSLLQSAPPTTTPDLDDNGDPLPW